MLKKQRHLEDAQRCADQNRLVAFPYQQWASKPPKGQASDELHLYFRAMLLRICMILEEAAGEHAIEKLEKSINGAAVRFDVQLDFANHNFHFTDDNVSIGLLQALMHIAVDHGKDMIGEAVMKKQIQREHALLTDVVGKDAYEFAARLHIRQYL